MSISPQLKWWGGAAVNPIGPDGHQKMYSDMVRAHGSRWCSKISGLRQFGYRLHVIRTEELKDTEEGEPMVGS